MSTREHSTPETLIPQLIRRDSPKVPLLDRQRDIAALILLTNLPTPGPVDGIEALSSEDAAERQVEECDERIRSLERFYLRMVRSVSVSDSDDVDDPLAAGAIESTARKIREEEAILDAEINYGYHVEGMSLSQIARLTGKSRSTIADAVKRHSHLDPVLRARRALQEAKVEE